MATNKRIKSKQTKAKLTPIPHNNRRRTKGRMVSSQVITYFEKQDNGEPDVLVKKTIFHMNLSPFEQRRVHVIKTAINADDDSILTMLNARERKMYEHMLKEKQLMEARKNYDNTKSE